MGWNPFGATSLRVQWRVAQVIVGLPVALWFCVWILTLVVNPGGGFDVAKALVMDPRALLPLVAALAFVLWVERHLDQPKAPATMAQSESEPPQST